MSNVHYNRNKLSKPHVFSVPILPAPWHVISIPLNERPDIVGVPLQYVSIGYFPDMELSGAFTRFLQNSLEIK
jgi:hypothetical protein